MADKEAMMGVCVCAYITFLILLALV